MQLLRSVSRSFYLSIRLLPQAMRAPVALGYLLARATDTVADLPGLSADERRDLLADMAHAVAQAPRLHPGLEWLQIRLDAAARALSAHPHEEALLQALPQCLQDLEQLSEADRRDVQWVLAPITQGQQLDVERFGHGWAALDTEAQADAYTWLVAGCVGEFWTRLCTRHWPRCSSEPADQLLAWGRNYGKGLQRLNMLRDTAADLAVQRCYWPAQALTALGLTPRELAVAIQARDRARLERLTPLYRQWLAICRNQLHDGLRYSLALRPLRLRLASVLPALIGVQTLRLMEQQGPMALLQPCKIPRRAVQWLLLRLLVSGVSRRALLREWQRHD